ncbi:terminase [Prosthecomicrobium hirschii]|uniref:Terminase n=1 Tax=Prosthecodimorpha hirschii TaxID=665126 RepID=A0A0P6W8I6_9HYPH|nr:phage terminase small subunit P27 family [Prosthecomicrobium hirschii]KPL55479.1 terminase [Prosthecomicrobium hirschii]
MTRGRKAELRPIDGGLASVPRAPSWLSKEAAQEWGRIMPGLIERRVLTDADMGTVEQFCVASGLVKRSQAIISAEGDMVDGRRHPAFQTLFQALTESRRLAAELGLTPASRNKAAAMKGGGNDDLADLDL